MKELADLKTRNDLADLLNVRRSILTYLLYIKGINSCYSVFTIPKKNGDERKICKPEENLMSIQRKLAEKIRETYDKALTEKGSKRNIAHGFIRGKSIITNAKIHKNKRYVFNVDLEDFFTCFHFGRVKGFFKKNQYFRLSDEVATIVAQLCCYEGVLPQGAPTSPIITNLICNVFDMRVLKLAKKYKLDYTRYADDLTFSTNDKTFLVNQKSFYEELSKEVKKAGFKINEGKVRLSFKESRQEVTGVIVNEKLNVNRSFYKETRAMANTLYKTGEFNIHGEKGTLNQLEGRFAYIDQFEKYNNKQNPDISKKKLKNIGRLSAKEKQYQQFLFYKYFFNAQEPVIITEGKTDVLYLKAALMNLQSEYKSLVAQGDSGNCAFKISFFERTERLSYFFELSKDGADTMTKICDIFLGKHTDKVENYFVKFKELTGTEAKQPIILLLDNEVAEKNKPLPKLIEHIKMTEEEKTQFKEKNWVKVCGNLYILTTPLKEDEKISDIECLFTKETLETIIAGKTFNKKDNFDVDKYYGKNIFSKHVISNYEIIDFTGFKPLLDNLIEIIEDYNNKQENY